MVGAVTPTPDVSIIVLNYRSWTVSALAMRSAIEASSPYTVEAIVVDNGSADGSASALRDALPEATVIGLDENLGFAAGMNVGIGASVGRYILLLNSDVIVEPGSVAQLVEYMASNPDVGIVAPLLLDSDGLPARSLLTRPTLLRAIVPFLAKVAYRKRRDRLSTEPLDVEATEGAAVLTSRDAISRVGVLDEGFFFYYEIVDWCIRMADCGLRVVVLPKSRMKHIGGSSTPRTAARIEFKRSEYYLLSKIYGNSWVRLVGMRDAVVEVIQVVFYGIAGIASGRGSRIHNKLSVHLDLARWFAFGMPDRRDQRYISRFGGWD